MARCQWRIDVFNGHGKIYEMSAAKISGTSFDEIVGHKQTTGQDHPLRKTLGKVAELASGYGGWIGAWPLGRNVDPYHRNIGKGFRGGSQGVYTRRFARFRMGGGVFG